MILDKVAEIIVRETHCKIEDVRPEAKLEELGIDSLQAIVVIFELEEAFDVEIPNEHIASIVTVKDIMDKLSSILH